MMSVGFATTQSTTTQHHGHISPMDVRPFLFRPFRLCPFLLSPLFLRPTRSSNATYILTKLPRIAPIKIFLVSIPTYISSSPQDPHPLLISTREKERRRRKNLRLPCPFLSSLHFISPKHVDLKTQFTSPCNQFFFAKSEQHGPFWKEGRKEVRKKNPIVLASVHTVSGKNFTFFYFCRFLVALNAAWALNHVVIYIYIYICVYMYACIRGLPCKKKVWWRWWWRLEWAF